jgi:O-methyltransferase involved in polyketide biosynthesis
MKQNSPSLTTHKVAVMRAAHQILDNPKAFEDPIALSIVGNQVKPWGRATLSN